MDNHLLQALDYIKASDCSYQEWLNVGMALKHEGYTADVWNEWSRADTRYKDGECYRKWDSFNEETATIVTGGTIVAMAKQHGYKAFNGNEKLSWESMVSGDVDPQRVVDISWIEDAHIKEPTDQQFNPVNEIVRYLNTLFQPEDYVGFVTDSWTKDNKKWFPKTGQYKKTAGDLIRELEQCNGDIGKVLGDYHKEAGAWIRFNPLDGEGVGNTNVKEYRYALVESDSISVSRQVAIMKELQLPIAAMTFSGNKSIHAIVHIDANSYTEYKDKVEYLYTICKKNGLNPDTQNKNPSRLSRMPGFTRGDKKQFLIATNVGLSNFNEWKEYIESVNDDLPDPVDLADIWNNMPDLSPCLINGILRKGHKMLLTGPSKAGKSFLLIELAIAIAENSKWLAWQCAQGRVLYVNLEVDSASCFHRFKNVYDAMKLKADNINNIDIWNLRGNSAPMNKLAPKLIRRAKKQNYTAVIIDPIYKVITGDENSASDMAEFCNYFDMICNELNCAVIYCHHHSKGAQGNKKSSDRASGSGVFARDPDAMLDLIQLVMDQPTRISAEAALGLDHEEMSRVTGWKVETTLREFPNQRPLNLFFNYPVHKIDEWDILQNSYADGDVRLAQKRSAESRSKKAEDNFKEAVLNANFGEPPTFGQLMTYLGVSKGAISQKIKKYGYKVTNGKVIKITSN